MAMSKMWRPSARRRMMFGPYLWLGPMGSLSPLHFDRTDNFLVQVYGQKRWTLIAPRYNTDVYFPCPQLSSTVMHFSPVDIEKPDLSAYPRFANVTPVEFVMGPGEVLHAGRLVAPRSLPRVLDFNQLLFHSTGLQHRRLTRLSLGSPQEAPRCCLEGRLSRGEISIAMEDLNLDERLAALSDGQRKLIERRLASSQEASLEISRLRRGSRWPPTSAGRDAELPCRTPAGVHDAGRVPRPGCVAAFKHRKSSLSNAGMAGPARTGLQ